MCTTSAKLVSGDRDNALVSVIPVPGDQGPRGSYHDFYAGWHPDTGTDRFYGGGAGGYYVYDISDLANPELLVTLHRHYRRQPRPHIYARAQWPLCDRRNRVPVRPAPDLSTLQPALDGEVSNINRPYIGLDGELEEPGPQP